MKNKRKVLRLTYFLLKAALILRFIVSSENGGGKKPEKYFVHFPNIESENYVKEMKLCLLITVDLIMF